MATTLTAVCVPLRRREPRAGVFEIGEPIRCAEGSVARASVRSFCGHGSHSDGVWRESGTERQGSPYYVWFSGMRWPLVASGGLLTVRALAPLGKLVRLVASLVAALQWVVALQIHGSACDRPAPSIHQNSSSTTTSNPIRRIKHTLSGTPRSWRLEPWPSFHG
jgi:hypothetical protein